MTQDKRKFIGSICVRFDTQNIKVEIAELENPQNEAKYRLRINRVWYKINGKDIYFTKQKLFEFIASLAIGEKYQTEPLFKKGDKCLYEIISPNFKYSQGTIFDEPILDFENEWCYAVFGYGGTNIYKEHLLKKKYKIN